MSLRIKAAGVLLLFLSLTLAPTDTKAVQSTTIFIDSATTQPVSTGIIPMDGYDYVFHFAEGAYRCVDLLGYTGGWINPNGTIRLQRYGQPTSNGMPYGALIGTWYDTLSSSFYMGAQGHVDVQPSNIGFEYKIGLNMSDTDLANLEGNLVIHMILLEQSDYTAMKLRVDNTSSQPIATGLIPTSTDDVFIIQPQGGLCKSAGIEFDRWFGPEGLTQLRRSGQMLADAPYGSILGTFNGSLSGGFYIGDGGVLTVQPVDVGDELMLGVNMSNADLSLVLGRIYADVILAPGALSAVNDNGQTDVRDGILQPCTPNPVNPSTTISYTLQSESNVLLRIYDHSGRVIRTLVDETNGPGVHQTVWDTKDNKGRNVEAGTYFYQVSTKTGSDTRQVVVMR